MNGVVAAQSELAGELAGITGKDLVDANQDKFPLDLLEVPQRLRKRALVETAAAAGGS